MSINGFQYLKELKKKVIDKWISQKMGQPNKKWTRWHTEKGPDFSAVDEVHVSPGNALIDDRLPWWRKIKYVS
jgi:hypothetical protein